MKLTNLKGVGEKTEKYFAKLGINSIEELLYYFPREYEVFEKPCSVLEAKERKFASVFGAVVEKPTVLKKGNLNIVNAYISDEAGNRIKAVWFNSPFIVSQLERDCRYVFRGKIENKNGYLSLSQPKVYKPDKYEQLLKTLQPVYGLTKGLTNNMITSAMKEAMFFAKNSKEYMPESIRSEMSLCNLETALLGMHFPNEQDHYFLARKRMAFDELFIFLLTLNKLNKESIKPKSDIYIEKTEATDNFINKLPFELTNAQKNAFDDIRKDLSSGLLMSRLIQGDVGSGKTILAVLAMMEAYYSGYQSALMVPTEVLAVQHFESIKELFDKQNIDIRLELLTGSMKGKEKKEAYERIKNGEADIIVGTHALIQEKLEYFKLGLVITDEQHRFGVKQREALQNKGLSPHCLVMSATPIPRTLAIILYGDLDISVINELPAERLAIKNCVVNKDYCPNAYRFIVNEVSKGHQAYVICPMVEYRDGVDAENVIEYSQKLKEAFPENISVAYLHGQMKADEKNEIMEKFANNKINVLVSTTVIEVGVNVKNATVMLIEDAQRFGLATLHQLRGRVGRSNLQSYCIMINTNNDKDSDERLEVLNKSNDGFFIASEDLKQRGPGDVLGIRQSGDMNFKIADLYNDAELIKKASYYAQEIINDNIYVSEDEKRLLEEKCVSISNRLSL